jgi:hypothetical protein
MGWPKGVPFGKMLFPSMAALNGPVLLDWNGMSGCCEPITQQIPLSSLPHSQLIRNNPLIFIQKMPLRIINGQSNEKFEFDCENE